VQQTCIVKHANENKQQREDMNTQQMLRDMSKMRKISPRAKKTIACIAIFGLLVLVPSLTMAGFNSSRIDAKFQDLTELAKNIAWGVLGVGAIIIAVKASQGDPDTKTRAWQFFFGALIIYMAPDIISWLKR
jgi:hypothetical protein